MADEPSPDATPDPESSAGRKPAASGGTQPHAEPQSDTKAAAQTEADSQPDTSAQPAAKASTPDAAAPAAKATKATKRAGAAKPAKPRQTTPTAGSLQIEEPLPPGALARVIHVLIRQTPSWLVSMVVHVVVLLALALISLPPPTSSAAQRLVITPDKDESLEEIEEFDQEPLEEIDFDVSNVVFDAPTEPQTIDPSPFDDITAARVSVEFSDIGLELAPKSDLASQVGTVFGNALDGRGSGKEQLLKGGGGNEASEQAVALALKWLAEHQLADGSWSFDHTTCPRCRGQCRNPGNISAARNGATGMALLPFLGAGQTHQTGKYKEPVRAGLYYLVNNMKVSPKGGSLFESGGSMYSHGICAIALCEAYAMTHDKVLYAPAQAALNFIAYAQDPVGGGWRYQERQRGDTSVVGWQIMAMKSGHMAYLRVPPVTVQKASRFLDSVQANNGAHYGYTDPAPNRDATTAVGLLCRMYLGWNKDNPALQRGVEWMSGQGPSKTNMYYNYYATQVMRHWEGDTWKKWNDVMRDQLVSSQATKGHEAGSWFMRAGHVTDRGGRLYCTSMAAMVLEVYYRHLPIYRKQAAEEEFPLE